MQYATDTVLNLISDSVQTGSLSQNAIRIIFWIAKALILRLQSFSEVLERLLGLLPNINYGTAVARGFGVLLAPDEAFSKENGARMRLLAKQKVFSVCIPQISKSYRDAETSVKSNYLIAMSGILRFVPTEVIMQEVDTLLPLLLQSLELEDQDVKAATMQSLFVVSSESPAAVEGHVGSIISRLLKAASNAETNDINVRLGALKCLKIFPKKIKESTLLPLRNMVTRGLMASLDDAKRDTRKEAVDCRAAWLDLDEPQSD